MSGAPLGEPPLRLAIVRRLRQAARKGGIHGASKDADFPHEVPRPEGLGATIGERPFPAYRLGFT